MSQPAARTRTLRALLPWLISLSLLGYVFYTLDWDQTAAAFRHADLPRLLGWVVSFVLFWLLLESLYLWVGIRWFAVAYSPYRTGPGPLPTYHFPFFDMIKARAASYMLTVLNFLVGYGGVVVYLGRRFGVPYQKGTAAMLADLLHELAALSARAWLAVRLLPVDAIPAEARDQIEVAASVGRGGLIFYLTTFLASRTWRFMPAKMQRESVFSPFVWIPLQAWPTLFLIKFVQNATYGLFVILTMPAFGLHPPAAASMALTQVVRLARGLPINAFGIGVDQVTFPYLFQGWAPGDQAASLAAFSLAFTFSLIAARICLGLPFFTKASRELFSPPAA